jgi:4-hydroxyphenylpyruvate dioxygenase
METTQKGVTLEELQKHKSTDFLPLNGTDYIEFYVGNAKQSAYFYQVAFGFELVAYAGLETGIKDRASYVLQQDKIRLVLTTSFDPESEISHHVRKHGDGVKVLALWVDDADYSLKITTEKGAQIVYPLTTSKDEFGEVKTASIQTYGETIHTFVERKNYTGVFLPGYKAVNKTFKTKSLFPLNFSDMCSKLNLSLLSQEKLSSVMQLYKALGGGWQ